MKKIRVAAVSYLNTKPLLYGLKHSPLLNDIVLTEDYPAKIAQQLQDGEVDVALIPVAATMKLTGWEVVSDFCIGADGPVASVCVFSEVPMDEIEIVYLDYQSRTSVNLARLLFRDHWKRNVKFVDAMGEEYRDKISGSTAGVVIGDRALEQRKRNKFIYDLGEGWKEMTGLPFVFAAWISTKPLPDWFVEAFNTANEEGLHHLPDVIRQNPFPAYDLNTYYTQNIDYRLDPQKEAGMRLFLNKLKTL